MGLDRPSRLQTDRLELVAATAAMCAADLSDRAQLAAWLDAEVPADDWPPPLLDAEALTWCRDFLTEWPEALGWLMWYLIATPENNRREAIGVVGFKGPPTPEGFVEIGYSIRAVQQGRGLGTEAVRALIGWGFAHPEVVAIMAHTFPDLLASIKVLTKLGFREIGPGDEAGTIRFELTRANRPSG